MPHFRNFDDVYFDFQSGTDAATAENDKGLMLDFTVVNWNHNGTDRFTYTVEDNNSASDGTVVPIFDSGLVVDNSSGQIADDLFLL